MRNLLLLSIFFTSSASAADISVLSNNGFTFIHLEGNILPGDGDKFSRISSNIKDATVMLNSNGGDLFSGLQIGTTIKRKSFATAVLADKTCASACGLIWYAGSVKYFHKNASIGFHSAYQIVNGEAQETGVGNALVGAYLTRLGATDKTIIFFTLAKPSSINWLTHSIANELGINYVPNFTGTPARSPRAQPLKGNNQIAIKIAYEYFDMMMKDKESARYYLLATFNSRVLISNSFMSKESATGLRLSEFFKWKSRAFSIDSNSLTTNCESLKSCEVSGSFTWAGRSDDFESGSGNFRFDIDMTKLSPDIYGDSINFY